MRWLRMCGVAERVWCAQVVLWKKNVDQVFEGVDECPICYTVLEREGLEDGGAHAARADALVALVAYDS